MKERDGRTAPRNMSLYDLPSVSWNKVRARNMYICHLPSVCWTKVWPLLIHPVWKYVKRRRANEWKQCSPWLARSSAIALPLPCFLFASFNVSFSAVFMLTFSLCNGILCGSPPGGTARPELIERHYDPPQVRPAVDARAAKTAPLKQ